MRDWEESHPASPLYYSWGGMVNITTRKRRRMSECTARLQPEATANYKCLFFLDVGHDALRPSKNSNQSHMVSLQLIKATFK